MLLNTARSRCTSSRTQCSTARPSVSTARFVWRRGRRCLFPSPLVGEGGAQSAPDEGLCPRRQTPHPSEFLASNVHALSHKGRGRNNRHIKRGCRSAPCLNRC